LSELKLERQAGPIVEAKKGVWTLFFDLVSLESFKKA
jgi:hypothetical protein